MKKDKQNNDISPVSDLTPKASEVKSSVPTMSIKEAEIRANFHTSQNAENTKDSDPTM
nr:hypothetical protein [uncultured Caproiciproducens sp.]